MGEVGRLLVELAADEEYFAPLIAAMSAESPGSSGSPSPTGALVWCSSTGPKE
jgi:hypothetical protein